MKMIYRGTSYAYNPVAVDEVESSMVGTYRGRGMHFTYIRHIPVPQPELSLSYRGVHYSTTANGEIRSAEPKAIPAWALASEPQPITLKSLTRNSRRAMLTEAAKVHQKNLEELLQHRLEVAKAKGDDMLVRQLEQEMQHLA